MVLNLDVQTAFDSMDHVRIVRALKKEGWREEAVLQVQADLTELRARASVRGVSATEWVDYRHGGRQGGADTPALWRSLLDSVLRPCVRAWEEAGLGHRHGAPGEEMSLQLLVWADNVWILGRSWSEAALMARAATEHLERAGMKWKA